MRKFWEIEFPVGSPTRGAPYGERTDPGTIAMVAAIGGAASGAASLYGALSGGKDSPAPPTVSKPTVMPSPDDDAMKLAKKKALAGQVQRRGRQSTVLESDTSGDLLGG